MTQSSTDYMESKLDLAQAEEPVLCQHQQDKIIIQFRNISHLCKQHAKEIHLSLKRKILGNKDVVIDLDGIVNVDAQGLAVLIYFHKKLTSQNHTITLTNPSASIRKLLWITEIDRLISTESEFETDFPTSTLENSDAEVYYPLSLTREKKYK